ncbi:MAG: hypothetical protein LBM67_04690 [Lentimicrobiaceae bacterium]|nr:hypothetical protein [Lentimicrobiaceae bacterium]
MIKSPFRYPGGKSRAVETIARLIPDFTQRKCPVRDNILVENGISTQRACRRYATKTAMGFVPDGTKIAAGNKFFYQYYMPNGTKHKEI